MNHSGSSGDRAFGDDGFDLTVVMACYTEDRIPGIEAALTSLKKQALQPRRVVVAVDNNDALAEYLRSQFDWIAVVHNRGARGAAATRNRGTEEVETSYIAFIDDDEAAEPDWLFELIQPFDDPSVVGTGGKYEATWLAGKPSWFPDEFAWAIGGAYHGLPTTTAQVRNVWSGNMAVRTSAFRQVGGFRQDFGKRGSIPRPEDTDLCIRMSAATAGRWMYVPSAIIYHDVPLARTTLAFFTSRCYAEGFGKAQMAKSQAASSALDTERDYAAKILLALLRRLSSLRLASSLQGLAMLLGLTSAASGYLMARLSEFTVSSAPAAPTINDRKPALIVDYDVDSPIDAFIGNLPDVTNYQYIWVLLRRSGRPVDIVEVSATTDDLREQLLHCVRATPPPVIADRQSQSAPSPAEVVTAPTVTVAICTRDRPNDLVRALESLRLQTYRDFRVLVVDNAPTGDVTAAAVNCFHDRLTQLDYVVEPTPGLSRARNCAVETISTDIVAWMDDDETADENWLAEIIDTFRRHPDAAAVSGSVVPAELETWPQWWFEQYGGHRKGRGFSKVVFPHGDTGVQNPLYPLPAFGAGANMAFRRDVLVTLGGFDYGLGAGTPTFGGEDTLVFSQLLLSGHTVVYQPAAMTRHFHRRSYPALKHQMFGYGVGLTAYYVALLRWDWRLVVPLLGLVPRALGDLLGADKSAVTTGLPGDFPPGLRRRKLRGMLLGPVAYLRARRVASSS
jgi:GT2 family glycosyltransferase